jgi:hypothetical protein
MPQQWTRKDPVYTVRLRVIIQPSSIPERTFFGEPVEASG